ncbi:hypothetical protein [Flindersiella endophytica]
MTGDDMFLPRVADLSAAVLDGSGFRRGWLAEDDKAVVPVVALSGIDRSLAVRCSGGARSAGADFFWVGQLENPDATALQVRAVGDDIQRDAPNGQTFIALPDLSAAICMTARGYALAAGRSDFLQGFCDRGVDGDRAHFRRMAAKLARRFPALPVVAEKYPPGLHAWSKSPPAGSAASEQLALMHALDRGEMTAPEFSRRWQAARDRSLDAGERTRDPLYRALVEVFYALEAYVDQPELRDAGDLDDAGLADAVRRALSHLPASS